MEKIKCIISLSGGMDSTTLLAWLIKEGYDVYPVWFNYGSKHNQKEIEAVEKICSHYNVLNKLKTIDITFIKDLFKSDLLITGNDIPEGHYEENNMSKTIIPFRNGIFISILTGYAVSIESDYIALGVHIGDHAIYPDCRKEFIEEMETSIQTGTDHYIGLLTPFINLSKVEICNLGVYTLDVPYNITWTCYKGNEKACGVCASCTERKEAFYVNFIEDSIEYDTLNDQTWRDNVLTYRNKIILEKISDNI